MGAVLNKLLQAYRKEQDEKYAQVKIRQWRELDGRRKRKSESVDAPPALGTAGAAAGEVAPTASTSKLPGTGGGVKKMRLVLSRSSPATEGAGSAAPSPGASSSTTPAVSPASSEFDL
jgi:hypothetical protein